MSAPRFTFAGGLPNEFQQHESTDQRGNSQRAAVQWDPVHDAERFEQACVAHLEMNDRLVLLYFAWSRPAETNLSLEVIDDSAKLVSVVRVAHRREVYE